MKFRLLRKHIDLGQPCDTDNCPLALCIGEATGLKTIVVVDTVDFYDEPHTPLPGYLGSPIIDTIPLPPSAAQFRQHFDARSAFTTQPINPSSAAQLPIAPFEFELALTAPVIAAMERRWTESKRKAVAI